MDLLLNKIQFFGFKTAFVEKLAYLCPLKNSFGFLYHQNGYILTTKTGFIL
jgi:hypothetical protein